MQGLVLLLRRSVFSGEPGAEGGGVRTGTTWVCRLGTFVSRTVFLFLAHFRDRLFFLLLAVVVADAQDRCCFFDFEAKDDFDLLVVETGYGEDDFFRSCVDVANIVAGLVEDFIVVLAGRWRGKDFASIGENLNVSFSNISDTEVRLLFPWCDQTVGSRILCENV